MGSDDEWECGLCGTVTAFERPECVDGHGDDCPDLVCVRCGAAVVVGVVVQGRSAA